MQFVGADVEGSWNSAGDGAVVGSDRPSNGIDFGESGALLKG
jgi:hypothetical protein